MFLWASGWFCNCVLFCMLMVPFLVYYLAASVFFFVINTLLFTNKKKILLRKNVCSCTMENTKKEKEI